MNRSAPDDAGHVADLLPAYINRTLDHDTGDRIDRHLGSCRACQADLEAWHAVAHLARGVTSLTTLPAPVVPDRVWAAVDAHPAASTRLPFRAAVTHARHVLVGQVPLLRRPVWAASALVMVLGLAIAAIGHVEPPRLVIELVAPIVAALGVSLIYGPEVDPSLEMALATPTSPRLILLARLTLVFGYDLLLTLVATVALVPLGRGGAVSALSLEWLGPMLFLSALALTLSLRLGPTVAMSMALLLWALRVFVAAGGQGLLTGQEMDLVVRAWSTNLETVAGAAVLTVLALRSIGREERLA